MRIYGPGSTSSPSHRSDAERWLCNGLDTPPKGPQQHRPRCLLGGIWAARATLPPCVDSPPTRLHALPSGVSGSLSCSRQALSP